MNEPATFSGSENLLQKDAELEVELASPWARAGAVVINFLLLQCALLPVLLSFPLANSFAGSGGDGGRNIVFSFLLGAIVTFLLLIGLAVWQCIWMSKRGQSIGKRIVGIRVLGLDGRNPGFVGTVLLREIVFNILVSVVAYIVVLVCTVSGFVQIVPEPELEALNAQAIGAFVSSSLSDLETWVDVILPSLLCFFMMFRRGSLRRTVQDYLAKTIVVKS